MEYSVAKKLVEIMLKHTAEQNSFLISIQGETKEDDFKLAQFIIAKNLANIYIDVLTPIFDKYPSLKPENF